MRAIRKTTQAQRSAVPRPQRHVQHSPYRAGKLSRRSRPSRAAIGLLALRVRGLQDGLVNYEALVQPDPKSQGTVAMLRVLVPLLEARAEEFGHIRKAGDSTAFRIYAVGNTWPRESMLRPHTFFVSCWSLSDDDGTYQEPPSHPYRVTWTNARGSRFLPERHAHDQSQVLRWFDDFMEGLLPPAEEEARLLELGRDSSRPLAVRRRALSKVIQTEVDPWPPGLDDAYADILADTTLSLFDRIAVAYECSAFGDPLKAERRRLLIEADQLDELPPSVELRVATELGHMSGLRRLVRLAASHVETVADEARERLVWMSHDREESPSIRQAAFSASMGSEVSIGHVFVSYVREDSTEVERLTAALRELGVPIWRDKDRLRPGDHWKFRISEAIKEGNAFLAVFSSHSESRERSYMRAELLEAVEELRLRPLNRTWFFPALLSPCEIPPVAIGQNETLRDLHYTALYEGWDMAVEQLAAALNEAVL